MVRATATGIPRKHATGKHQRYSYKHRCPNRQRLPPRKHVWFIGPACAHLVSLASLWPHWRRKQHAVVLMPFAHCVRASMLLSEVSLAEQLHRRSAAALMFEKVRPVRNNNHCYFSGALGGSDTCGVLRTGRRDAETSPASPPGPACRLPRSDGIGYKSVASHKAVFQIP